MSYPGTPLAQTLHRPTGSFDYNAASPPPPPPKPGSGTQTPSRGPPLPPPPSQAGNFYEYTQPYTQQAGQGTQYVQPPEPGWLPAGLADRSVQDLHHLLEDPDLQAALLDSPATSHPSIAQSEAPLKDLLEANIALSNILLQLEAQVLAKRTETQSRLLSLRALEQQHRGKISETENELSSYSPMALYQRLNASVQEQDGLVKVIEDSFLEEVGMATDREVQDFVRKLREAKRLAFLRNERKLRWDEARVGGWR